MCTISASARYRHSVDEMSSVKALHRIAPTGKAESGKGVVEQSVDRRRQSIAMSCEGKVKQREDWRRNSIAKRGKGAEMQRYAAEGHCAEWHCAARAQK